MTDWSIYLVRLELRLKRLPKEKKEALVADVRLFDGLLDRAEQE